MRDLKSYTRGQPYRIKRGGYEMLAGMVVIRAAEDWRYAENNPDILILDAFTNNVTTTNELKAECEEFFTGDWLEKLTTLDGKSLLAAIKYAHHAERRAENDAERRAIATRAKRRVLYRE